MLAFIYIVASILFIISIKLISQQRYARLGNRLSALAMLLAVTATLIKFKVMFLPWVAVAFIIGAVAGIILARIIKMTAMPQAVSMLNGSGGLASLCVAVAESFSLSQHTYFSDVVISLTIIVGAVTFSGSLVAFMKFSRWLPSRAMVLPLHRYMISLLLIMSIIFLSLGVYDASHQVIYLSLAIICLFSLGIFSVISIGGADMPVVISLLNSYSGIAACLAGFILNNNMIVVGGALVGASGFVLTVIMCKSMNRSLANVLFGASKPKPKVQASSTQHQSFVPRAIKPADAYYRLEAAHSVMIVPGYGMAVAQAQHALAELMEILENNGCEVNFAIHPVAGRMPGHMNVLLAEAGIPYDKFLEPSTANPKLVTSDVCIVVGANDVVNPAARDREDTPIYGMPIIDADRANTVMIIKRSLAYGFAGIDNELYYKDNTIFLFGDAKTMITDVILEFRD